MQSTIKMKPSTRNGLIQMIRILTVRFKMLSIPNWMQYFYEPLYCVRLYPIKVV